MTDETGEHATPHWNRLIAERSPYLLQHARNPVDWHPWCDEAFEQAERKNKPIFLSIGYSTCHWCHVMARESFENPDVAALLNEAFICIKVDREERPDVDKVYMAVCQALTGSGGWPLTIIMTPERKPFFAATYVPPESRCGRVGLKELTPRISELWKNRRRDLLERASFIAETFRQERPHRTEKKLPGREIIDETFAQLRTNFDSEHGGFGTAPKFPSPHNLLFLLKYWRRTGEPAALAMTELTLTAIRQGGLYDHLGFGIHRYSTDDHWLVPHFEKMLYDQAMTATAFSDAYLATKKDFYGKAAREICDYVVRDLSSGEGGFHTAEDADSEGAEGKFYLWSMDEFRTVLGDDAPLAAAAFSVEERGNFDDEDAGETGGRNILHLKKPMEESAADLGVSSSELEERLEVWRKKLFEARSLRPRPLCDDKILTDWNGLMIAALARVGRSMNEPRYVEAAEKAASFILNGSVDGRGRLLHSYAGGSADVPANLDDYAFLIWGLIELYETTFRTEYLDDALRLQKLQIENFWDGDEGGYFFTSDGGERLLVRTKDAYDGAIPSGNSVAFENMLRLGLMTGDAALTEKGRQLAVAFSGSIAQSPTACVHMVSALDLALGPSREIVIAGVEGADDANALLDSVRSRYLPATIVLFRPMGSEEPPIADLAPFTKNMTVIDGKATAHVCIGGACRLPVTEIQDFIELLEEN
ncbi:MAG: thioredoxin domain-containing protein [Deltaproteobacteria bacterium]|nr:thioredoxin domain-containing protein [Deltaproteobacteria bacterium]